MNEPEPVETIRNDSLYHLVAAAAELAGCHPSKWGTLEPRELASAFQEAILARQRGIPPVRVYGCAADPGGPGEWVEVGSAVRESGSIATTVTLSVAPESPVFLCDRSAGQLAAGLLARAYAPDA